MVPFILVEITRPLSLNPILLEDSSSDGNVSGERALVVDVLSGDGLLWSLETQTNVSVVSQTLGEFSRAQILLVHEDGWLLLVCFFSLLRLAR